MLLLIDHLALRARNYEYLIRLFQEWEVRAVGPALKVQLCLPFPFCPHRGCLGTVLGSDAGSLSQSSGRPQGLLPSWLSC